MALLSPFSKSSGNRLEINVYHKLKYMSKCYKKQVLQVSYDNGASWSSTTTVKYGKSTK